MKKIIMGIVILMVFLVPGKSEGLSCAEPLSPKEAFDQYDGVFKGKVKEMKIKSGVKVLTVHVYQSYKGVSQNVITVKENSMWGESKADKDYLFYLVREQDEWWNPLCSDTTTNHSVANIFLSGKALIEIEEVKEIKDSERFTFFGGFGATILIMGSTVLMVLKRKAKLPKIDT